MTPFTGSPTLDFTLSADFLLGLVVWVALTALGWTISKTFQRDDNKQVAQWTWIVLSVLLFIGLVDIPPFLLFFVGTVFSFFLIWSLHTVPISFVLGFYFRHKIKRLDSQMVRIQGYGRIYSIGILSIVVQKEDLTEASLSYTELLQKGLQISDQPPLSEWQITLPTPISPEAIQIFERRLGNMAWFAVSPAPSIWPQANQSNTLIVRGTLLRAQDYARVIQIFYRDLRALSKEYPLS